MNCSLCGKEFESVFDGQLLCGGHHCETGFQAPTTVTRETAHSGVGDVKLPPQKLISQNDELIRQNGEIVELLQRQGAHLRLIRWTLVGITLILMTGFYAKGIKIVIPTPIP